MRMPWPCRAPHVILEVPHAFSALVSKASTKPSCTGKAAYAHDVDVLLRSQLLASSALQPPSAYSARRDANLNTESQGHDVSDDQLGHHCSGGSCYGIGGTCAFVMDCATFNASCRPPSSVCRYAPVAE